MNVAHFASLVKVAVSFEFEGCWSQTGRGQGACVVSFYLTHVWNVLRSRGFLESEQRGRNPRLLTSILTLSPLKQPRMSGSPPCILTTSLAIQIPSSFLSNGPTTTMLTTRGLCPGGSQAPGGSVVWAGPKFFRPHSLRS